MDKRIVPHITRHVSCAYDGWNPVAEWERTGTTLTLKHTHLWGLDIGSSGKAEAGASVNFQQAGGITGLIASTYHNPSSREHFLPGYDANGNIIAWTSGTGSLVKKIDYDAFGNEVIAENFGDVTKLPAFGFSTKIKDAETGLSYYGYRYYDPVTGRWPSRDPIEEMGGIKLYAFVGNDGVNRWDILGLFDIFIHTDGVGHMGCEVLNTTWDLGRYLGKYTDTWTAIGEGPLIIRKESSNPNKTKPGFKAFTFEFGQDVDQAVSAKFQSLFNGGKTVFPKSVSGRLPKSSHVIPANMRYMGKDWTWNTCNCITETKDNIVVAVREVAKKTSDSKKKSTLDCYADELEKMKYTKPEDYSDGLQKLQDKYKNP